MATQSEALRYLQNAIGNSDATFRPGQWEAIDHLVNQKGRMLVVERTGWGKSSVYFITTIFLRQEGRGLSLIISPLLALMRNQIATANQFGLNPRTINSTNPEEWEEVKEEALRNEIDVLFISPERLANEKFVEQLLLPLVDSLGLFVVDEAHCISDWGHDFRVDYRRIVNILQRLPANIPVLATTATANDRVVQDVESQLGDVRVQRGTLERSSLHLQTIKLPDQPARLAWLAQNLPRIPGTGIIYVLTKRDAIQLSAWLRSQNIDAHAYFAGIKDENFENDHEYRIHLEDQLLANEIKVLVATTALSMGYDKPDLSFVIHYQAPGSIVGYYQQVGRAGRGIDKAYGVMLSGREDEDIHDYFRRNAFPTDTRVQKILQALEESDHGLSIPQLTQELNFRSSQISQTIKYLSVESPAPVVKIKTKWQRAPVPYQLDKEKIAYLTAQRYCEWQEVQEYLSHEACLMAYLRRSLDDPEAKACGRCAHCIGEPVLSIDIDQSLGNQAALFIRHAEFPLVLKKQFPPDVRPYGLSAKAKIPENYRGEEGRVLSRWRDAGWGRTVAENKQQGHFNDELVTATAEMIARWNPEPELAWVCCVPSLNHPTLVADFAQRLAHGLGIPFHHAIQKIKDTPPQKNQENSYFQCLNLDGAFEITQAPLPEGAVLLVDDAVDSAWTLTILTALLRQAGSGPVFPLALTSTQFRD